MAVTEAAVNNFLDRKQHTNKISALLTAFRVVRFLCSFWRKELFSKLTAYAYRMEEGAQLPRAPNERLMLAY